MDELQCVEHLEEDENGWRTGKDLNEAFCVKCYHGIFRRYEKSLSAANTLVGTRTWVSSECRAIPLPLHPSTNYKKTNNQSTT